MKIYPKINLINQKFGKLKVIDIMPERKKRYIIWKCVCDCGNISYVRTNPLLNGKISSCKSCSRTKHNLCNTRIYHIWEGIKGRCLNKNNKDYKNYGGRNISLYSEWKNFINFYNWAIKNGYKENLQIDRINVNGNYEPINCRWVSSSIQNNNKRNNKIIIIDGISKTISQWSKELKTTRYLIEKKYNDKYTEERNEKLK